MEYLVGFYLSTALLIYLWSRKRLTELPHTGLVICSILWLPAFLAGLIVDLVVGGDDV